jgi:serine/threonine protein kinase
MSAPTVETDMIGRTIGKYRIVGQIGRGGAGIVYKAVDETLNREVAIKTLNPDLANTEVMKRFRAEATILAKLNHPQIATIFELFRSETDLLMVMEFVRGETLDKLSQRFGPLTPEGAAYLIDQILSALEHAHRAGVVHRDMKPGNVMVTETGGVKIMDFGIARVRGAEQMTVDGRLMGTPAYMPPEQVLGQEVDGRADLYAVGVVFYRLLTGALPFTADTALAMLQQQILETPVALLRHREGLPDWCEPIVQRALAKAPADRFQTAEEFREEVARATGLLPTADLARMFAVAPSVDSPGSSRKVSDTLDLSRGDVMDSPSVGGAGVTTTLVWRQRLAWAYSMLAVVAMSAAVLGYMALPRSDTQAATEPLTVAVPAPAMPVMEPAKPVAADPPPVIEVVTPDAAPRRAAEEPARLAPATRRSTPSEPLLIFETKTVVGTKKPREHDAQLVLADGRITVTSDVDSEYPFYSIPYGSVISISYSRGRDPMWNSPEGPAQVTRSGGALGRLGIVVARDWISLRTNTKDQFVTMRFDELLVRRILLALEERTGRRPELLAQPKDAR